MENLTKKCPRCGRDVDSEFLNTSGGCAVCDWLVRYPERAQNDIFTSDDTLIVIESFLLKKWKYINEIVDYFNGKYSTEQCIELIDFLKIANRPTRIKVPCASCGKDVEVRLAKYKSNKYILCDRKCYSDFRRTLIGEKNPGYRRVVTSCSNCGKEIKVIPYYMNHLNSFGESNNFCSRDCYKQFRSKHYAGEKHPMYNHQYTDEQLDRLRRSSISNLSRAERLNSGIQQIVDNVLERNHIEYKREFLFDYYSVDNYLIDCNLIIEVMGDYWHGNPKRYNENRYRLNQIQTRTILKDKQKKGYISTHFGVPILYLWETDINKNPKLCERLILQFISQNGELEDYHSFNYELNEDGMSLKLNEQILTPYQDMHSSSYAYLVS